jgi:hypothetical protein
MPVVTRSPGPQSAKSASEQLYRIQQASRSVCGVSIAGKFEAAYFFEINVSEEIKVSEMLAGTILFISDHGPGNDLISRTLEATGHDVVSTDFSTQAVAMLFVMACVTAVVIGEHWIKQSSFDLTRSLRALCPEVPIIALCDGGIDRLPPGVDSCVNTRQPLGKITSDLKSLLAEKSTEVRPTDSCS